MKLLVGPAGSGKTTRLLAGARETLKSKGRVWWLGLPQQRSYLYRRATAGGALLGLEFLAAQGLYYKMLAAALKLRPLVVGTARVALVGEALKALENSLPSPGEASLFTRAIAEAKRYGLSWRALPGGDAEARRFKEVFKHYEKFKGERWDYDDFRLEALTLAEGAEDAKSIGLEADLIIIDGYRELSPLELRLYDALSRHVALWLSLPEAPPGYTASETLDERQGSRPRCYLAPNPVAEARWVLRSLKHDLAQGLDPLELAVIVPEGRLSAFAALADEYGVPLMDESPKALADTPAGRLLLELLELPDAPTASRLLLLPELAPLAREALAQGVAGREALSRLADGLGLAGPWQRWLARLDVPEGEERWAKELIMSLPELANSPYREALLERAKEAMGLARGAQFRRWWAALLAQTPLYQRSKGGVALLTAKLASGRRFKRLYLMHAAEGAYKSGEGEDYFIPEEARLALEASFERFGLPKRFLGRDRLLFAELLTRADEEVVTCPQADQGGPIVAEGALVKDAETLPEVPFGSRLELPGSSPYRPQTGTLPLGAAHVEALRHYSTCAFRYWALRHLRDDDTPWWRALIADLRTLRRLDEHRLDTLLERYPQAESWLLAHRPTLLTLSYGVSLPERGSPQARLDAAWRQGGRVTLYSFAEPESLKDAKDAEAFLSGRWAEWWAAGYALSLGGRQVRSVTLCVWPLLGEPITTSGEITYPWRRIQTCQRKVDEAHARFSQGDVSASPGFHCRDCSVKDVCREAH